MHHAQVIEGGVEAGIERALAWVREALGLETVANPDVTVLRYGLFSVDDARRVQELAMTASVRGTSRVIVIAVARLYHESQNVLLKLFEEPPEGTYLVLVVPTLGALLPTLRSRVQILEVLASERSVASVSPEAVEFIAAAPERRVAIVKKLTTGKDEEQRRAHRDTAIALVNGVEAVLSGKGVERYATTLRELATLRGYLYDRSAPLKQILEHVAIVTPKGLV